VCTETLISIFRVQNRQLHSFEYLTDIYFCLKALVWNIQIFTGMRILPTVCLISDIIRYIEGWHYNHNWLSKQTTELHNTSIHNEFQWPWQAAGWNTVPELPHHIQAYVCSKLYSTLCSYSLCAHFKKNVSCLYCTKYQLLLLPSICDSIMDLTSHLPFLFWKI
jgi:hypothetical protein